jgi:imidazolonepropionase-like amidohydrolase
LKYFQVMGMSDEDALNLITLKNAEILGIDDQLGTIQPGKLASLIVWDRHPLHIGATPVAIFAEGTRVR